MNKKYIILSVAVLAFTLVGCGGSGGGDSTTSTPSNTISFSGVAIDGYIKDATACLDLNINGTCDAGEPTTSTAIDGTFSFTDVNVPADALMPVIVSGGTDTATGKAFSGALKNVLDAQSVNGSTKLHVTPLTDLVASSFIASSDKSASKLAQLKTDIATSLGLSTQNVDADPMKNKEIFIKAQEIEQAKALIEVSAFKSSASLNEADKQNIRNKISKAYAQQILEGGEDSVTDTITILEQSSTITIPENEKKFISSQINELKTTLNAIGQDATINTSSLDTLQNGLSKTQEEVLQKIESAKQDNTLSVVQIPDIITLINDNNDDDSVTPPAEPATSPATDDNSVTPPATPATSTSTDDDNSVTEPATPPAEPATSPATDDNDDDSVTPPATPATSSSTATDDDNSVTEPATPPAEPATDDKPDLNTPPTVPTVKEPESSITTDEQPTTSEDNETHITVVPPASDTNNSQSVPVITSGDLNTPPAVESIGTNETSNDTLNAPPVPPTL